MALSFASEYPDFVEKLCVISCTGRVNLALLDVTQADNCDCDAPQENQHQGVSLFDMCKGKQSYAILIFGNLFFALLV